MDSGLNNVAAAQSAAREGLSSLFVCPSKGLLLANNDDETAAAHAFVASAPASHRRRSFCFVREVVPVRRGTE
jgi:hypothetical protein